MSTQTIDDSSRQNLEFDLHEIDLKLNNEIPLEIQCQIGNILSVVKEAIEKLKITLILPKILENPKVLHQYLKDTEYENSMDLVREYRNATKSKSLPETNPNDYQLIKLIDYFHENYKILNVLPNWLDDIDNTEKYLVKAFEDVYKIAEQRFIRPATADLTKEKRIHEIFFANENAKQQLERSAIDIQSKIVSRNWKHAAKTGACKLLEDELAFIKYNNKLIVEEEMKASQREIQLINIELTSKKLELEEDLNKARSIYKKKLNDDLIQESSIKEERNKLQIQLQALIKKYDQTIYDKYTEELFLQEEYEKQTQELNTFLIEFKREDDIYEEVVRKKEREYKRLHDLKILLFTTTYAAKKIQKWWRRIQKKRAKEARAKNKANDAKGKQTGKQAGNKKDTAKPAPKGKKK